jgi:lysyl-tRNA synthetase class 2
MTEPEGPETTSPTDERDRRLAKLEARRAGGADPYPYRYDRTHTAADLRAKYGELAPGTETDDRANVAGRLVLIRRQGKLTFATLRDRSGDIQLFVSRAVAG